MPPPKKIDLLPAHIRDDLNAALEAAGFGDIIATTEKLNQWLAEEGEDLTVGKSAVGEYAKVRKMQRDALELAREVLSDIDVEREGEVHAALSHMLSANAVEFMKQAAQEGEPIGPQAMSHMARFMKDSMASSRLREAMREDERERVKREALEAERAAQAERLEQQVDAGEIDAAAHEAARRALGFG